MTEHKYEILGITLTILGFWVLIAGVFGVRSLFICAIGIVIIVFGLAVHSYEPPPEKYKIEIENLNLKISVTIGVILMFVGIITYIIAVDNPHNTKFAGLGLIFVFVGIGFILLGIALRGLERDTDKKPKKKKKVYQCGECGCIIEHGDYLYCPKCGVKFDTDK